MSEDWKKQQASGEQQGQQGMFGQGMQQGQQYGQHQGQHGQSQQGQGMQGQQIGQKGQQGQQGHQVGQKGQQVGQKGQQGQQIGQKGQQQGEQLSEIPFESTENFRKDPNEWSTHELLDFLHRKGVDTSGTLEKSELIKKLRQNVKEFQPGGPRAEKSSQGTATSGP